ncbi:thioredoxin domain-containing protein [Oceanobacillus bengalensis]|uniref:Thioredoxin domain-containing protein n=1 Tax=Oceanobacillus bengalensis TaxID=1435466 RepID=A0A494Z234_9BACI|nr:thioredoxin domain-containing protein [Oceanobacillus bengalensis]RKQ16543.1 thioredoxin domain-containing protein [Oceanobacillus bengalensis]
MKTNREPNRLIAEKSPYLLQHAYNPVNWHPWGDKAFTKAKQENKPIFLSIGYSTCHWCHVMAHESFEDDEVAAVLNEKYVSIKVDREERPDVDSVYMKVCQMMTGHGGWPLTIIMTPDKIPFYAGTYFPKTSKYGRPGIMEVLTQLHGRYIEDPNHITEITNSVTNALQRTVMEKSKKRLTTDTLQEAYQHLAKIFDFTYGGFGEAPKFPMPQNALFLLRHYHFTGNSASLKIVEKTLKDMAAGGIWDHIGYGFSRYSTDDEWLVPHFEKMLYDNALLLIVYTECFQITHDPFYRKLAEQIITFIKREMTSSDGAFYSAIDADSEGVEGKYYVWDYEEIYEILGTELGELYTKTYDITPQGNFEGNNIPNLIDQDLEYVAREHNLPLVVLKEKLEKARAKLLTAREKRIYPHVDDKVLTGWNGLMIAALSKAGKVIGNTEYIQMAETAMNFAQEKLFLDGRLMARYRDGETKFNAYIDDYAFLLWAYVELYDATFFLEYIKSARNLADQMIDLFWDGDDGGFYFSGKDSEELIAKDKEIYDGAIPSGNSVTAVMLTRLGYLTGETSYLDKVEEMYYTFFADVNRQAAASPFFLQSLQLMENPTKEVVVLGKKNDPALQSFLEELQIKFIPNITLLVGERPEDFSNVAPFATEYKQLDDAPTIYVCENFACKQPTTELDKALKMI